MLQNNQTGLGRILDQPTLGKLTKVNIDDDSQIKDKSIHSRISTDLGSQLNASIHENDFDKSLYNILNDYLQGKRDTIFDDEHVIPMSQLLESVDGNTLNLRLKLGSSV